MFRRDHGNHTSTSTSRCSSAPLLPSFHPIILFSSPRMLSFAEMLFPVCYSLALDLILYFPICIHITQSTSVTRSVLYCTGIRSVVHAVLFLEGMYSRVTLNDSARNARCDPPAKEWATGFGQRHPVATGPKLDDKACPCIQLSSKLGWCGCQ